MPRRPWVREDAVAFAVSQEPDVLTLAGDEARADVERTAVWNRMLEERRQAEEAFGHERSVLQDRLVQEVVDRQRRHTKVEAPELRAVTRKMRQMRGDTNASPKGAAKREQKGYNVLPLRQGEVEADFEAMAGLTQHLAPLQDSILGFFHAGVVVIVSPGHRRGAKQYTRRDQ